MSNPITDQEWFTIDSASSVDLDDALAWGPYGPRIAITIPKVPTGSDLDLSARQMMETRYAPPVRPMLPTDLGSLMPGVARQCLVLDTEPEPNLAIETVKSKAKLTYEDIPAILADPSHRLHANLCEFRTVALNRLEQRRTRGALALYDLNEGWYTDEDGRILRLERAAETIGHIIVQEMMILFNKTVAEYAAEHTIPILYRNHTARPNAPARHALQQQLDLARLDPASLNALRERIHLTMNRATYDSTLLGHYGLNLPAYTHCSSPLRRYADLATQRQLVAHLGHTQAPYTQEDLCDLAADLTTRKDAHEATLKQRAKERAAQRAEWQVSRLTPERLAALTPKEFERIVKVSVTQPDPDPALAPAVRLRMDRDTFALLDAFYILFRSPKAPNDAWDALRFDVCKWLRANPHHALSVLALGLSPTLGGWSPITFTQTPGPSGSVTVTASLDIPIKDETNTPTLTKGATVTTPPIPARALWEGKQRAALALVCFLASVPLPTWTAKAAESKTAPEGRAHPVSLLQERCQQARQPTPEYEISSNGQTPPTFTAVVKVGTRTYTGAPAPTKKEAKTNAARAALQSD